MKNKIALVITIIIMGSSLCGCSKGNQQLLGDYQFNKADIKLMNGEVITVDVESYTSGSNSVIIKTTDGEKYGTSYQNVVFYN